MKNSRIAWCDHTFNPWVGCAKVSPGCANCYAETIMDTRFGKVKWGAGNPRARTTTANWRQPLQWDRAAAWQARDAEACGRDPGPCPRIFCGSLCDWLDPEVPVEWLAELLAVIKATRNLTWQLLTKRPEHWRTRMWDVVGMRIADGPAGIEQASGSALAAAWLNGFTLPNLWVGVTVEDQQRADERIPWLLNIPAYNRFLSCEPMLGPINLSVVTQDGDGPDHDAHGNSIMTWIGHDAGIDWVIAGCESGPKARVMQEDWARSLRDQCAAAGVPFFFKQAMHGGKLVHLPELDGRQHREFPVSASRGCVPFGP